MLPQPHGQTTLSGSITSSTCGRPSGRARALRGARGLRFSGSGSLAAILSSTAAIWACVSAMAVSRSSSASSGFRPELRAPIVLNLTFQLLDQRLQLGDEGLLLGDHRLFVLARRAFNRKLELNRRKGLHHLGRQVRELAEIEGLRHAHSYPIRDGMPNKTTLKSAL
jgi:hypothetical protein